MVIRHHFIFIFEEKTTSGHRSYKNLTATYQSRRRDSEFPGKIKQITRIQKGTV
jgi:hypothetical protein